MTKLKKMLALLVVFMMVVSTVAVAAVPDDVKGTDYEEAASVLGVLNIMNGDDGGFRPDDTITRAEFAAVVARALDLEDAAKVSGGTTEYTDVPATHWAAGYINLASDMEIINGYGNGNFGPEDTVKYEQALTMIVRALGYEPAAKQKGGYPVGYLFIASNEGITDDIDAVSGTPALRGDVAQMVYNSLTVDMMEQDEYGDEATFKKKEGKNLLTEYLDVDKVLGVLSGTYWADFGRNLGKNEVAVTLREVNDEEVTKTVEKYEVGDNKYVEQLLGNEVELFVTDDDEIITISRTDSNETLSCKMETEDYDKDGNLLHKTGLVANKSNDEVTSYTFNFYIEEDDEWDDVKVDKDALFIVNGEDVKAEHIVAYGDGTDPKYDCGILSNNSWSMAFKLINNDEDGDYDSINQVCGAPMVVDYYDAEDKELYTLRDTDPKYEFDDDDNITVTTLMAYYSGDATSKLKLEDLKKGDVLVGMMSPSEDQYFFILSPFVSEGVIEEVREEVTHPSKLYPSYVEIKTHVTIDGKESECDRLGVVDLNDEEMFTDFSVGDEGLFYMDLEGKVVAIDFSSSSDSSNYGYLLDSEASDEDFESGRKFKILTAKGDEVIYEGAEEIETNVIKNEGTDDEEIVIEEVDADQIYDLDDTDIPANGVALGKTTYIDLNGNGSYDIDSDQGIGQLIQYELNSNGEITEIYTEDSNEFDADGSMEDAKFNEDTRKMYITDGDGDVIDDTLLGKDTLVFFIDTDDEDDSDVYTVADISDEDTFADVYYYTENGDLEVIVIRSTEFEGASTDYEIAVVDRVTKVKNDSDDKVSKLYAYIKGEEVQKIAEDTISDLDNSSQGDILYITYNSDGEIDGVEEVEFDYNGDAVAFAVYDKDSESITIWKGGKEVSESFASTYYVYKIDESADEFTVESYSDIKTKEKNGDNYSQVALGFNDDEQVEVVVIYSE